MEEEDEEDEEDEEEVVASLAVETKQKITKA